MVPPLTTRLRNPYPIVVVCVVLMGSGYAGMLIAPAAGALFWATAFGLGVSTFPLCLTLIGARAENPQSASRRSGVVQGVGYGIGCVGPLALGAINQLSDDWTGTYVLLAATLLIPWPPAGPRAGRSRRRPVRLPPVPDLDRAALGTRVTELFRSQVTDGSWPLGSKIPTEPELVEWTGAGRNTVREAISSLVQTGILRREQGRGTFVVSTSDLSSSVSRRAASTARRDSLELRLALDAASARLAAVRCTGADAERLVTLLDERRDAWAGGNAHERVRADSALHRAVVAATHNTLLQDVYEGLLGVFEEVQLHDVTGETDDLAQLHADLIEAIVDGDPERAAATMATLLQPMINQAR